MVQNGPKMIKKLPHGWHVAGLEQRVPTAAEFGDDDDDQHEGYAPVEQDVRRIHLPHESLVESRLIDLAKPKKNPGRWHVAVSLSRMETRG